MPRIQPEDQDADKGWHAGHQPGEGRQLIIMGQAGKGENDAVTSWKKLSWLKISFSFHNHPVKPVILTFSSKAPGMIFLNCGLCIMRNRVLTIDCLSGTKCFWGNNFMDISELSKRATKISILICKGKPV